MLQLIYELRTNCCGTGGQDGTGKSKVLLEVLADLKKLCKILKLNCVCNDLKDFPLQTRSYFGSIAFVFPE